ncbi:hypothetical protein I5907_18995 [Panacibacter sp. DH6]|uniref:Uncharacterized protein n=1 Tax=Panacibacter microcysteis TaxID=2793269 RepID=A0A931GZU4_9BACT|nr:hypothetical protein [Panacibacter microcysteis]MBG9378333.1 hypothetical protein [Panacibacter microcysteis]
MKQLTKSAAIIFSTFFLSLIQLALYAQEAPEVKVNNTDVGTWIGQNWIWVVGVVVLLLILLLASGGRSRASKTTTVRRDNDGRITTVTTVTNE